MSGVSERLSAEDKEALRTSGSWPHVGTDLFAAVERILAAHLADAEARLAKVEALADEKDARAVDNAERMGVPFTSIIRTVELRAALRPDPSEARDG